MHRILFSAVVATVVTLSGCGSCQNGAQSSRPELSESDLQPVQGGRLIDSGIGEPSVFLPPLVTDSASSTITSLVYSSLLRIGKDLDYEPDLAESWEVSEDGLQLTFHLRKDVKFHDGRPLTADDVVFTYEALMDPETPSPYKPDFMDVEKFEKVDDYTVRITYREAFAPALGSYAGLRILPKHLLEGTKLTESDLRFNPVGSGPYKFVEWRKGDRVILRANEDFYRGEPKITEYVLRVIPDQATTFLELKAGGIDQMTPTPVQYDRQTDTKFFKDNINKFDYLGFGYTYLGFNNLDPRFKDKRVRKAISMAINRDELVSGVLLGLGEPANGPYKPGAWYYDENIKPTPFDPEGARKLLEEAGYTYKDGVMLQPDGKPFSFTILTNQGNESRRKTAEIIQRRLAELGVQAAPRIIEWSAFINDFVDKKNFDTVLLGWNLDLDPDQYTIWHSSQTDPKQYNFVSYTNPELDKLLVEGRKTFDQEERRAIYNRVQEILAEDEPYAFLYVPYSLVLLNNRVHGVEVAAAGIGWNFEEWFIPKPLQNTPSAK